jgi:peptide/nickel transport system substrate-binding protein
VNQPPKIDLIDKVKNAELDRRSLIKTGAIAGAAASVGLSRAASAAPQTGPSRSASRFQADEKTLVVLDDIQGQNWLYFDPGKFYEINPAAGMNMIYEGLYNLPDGTKLTDFQPQLADGMPTYSDDKLTATIKLRQGVKFQNTGNPFTADDVVFSFNRLANLKSNPSFLVTDFMESVTAVDPSTVAIKLKSVNAALLGILSAVQLTITDSVAAKKHGGTDAADADQTDKLTDWLNSGNSLGTGPYRCTAWDISNEIVLEANPDYWGDKPNFDRIIFRNQSNSNTQLDSIANGEADMAFAIDPDAVSRITPDSGMQLVQGPSLALEYVAMNNSEDVGGILSKKEVRQAIAKAIDYNGIINDLLGKGAVRPATVIPLGLLGADDVESMAYQTDINAAQALFDSAGVGPTEITLTWGSGQATPAGLNRDVLAPKLKSDIEKIKGLTVKLQPMDPTQRLADYRAAKLQFTMSDWSPDYPDVHTYADPFGRTGGAAAKRVNYSDPQVDQLLDQGIAELDPAKRKDIYVQIQKILIDDAAFLVDFQPNYRSPASSKVQGAQTHGIYILQLRNVTKTA